MKQILRAYIILIALFYYCDDSMGQANVIEGEAYSVIELQFEGPEQGPRDAPARDIDFWIVVQHESKQIEFKIHGFWDGDGQGGSTGNVFKVRFCPTRPGKWTIQTVHSNHELLNGQKQGTTILAKPSTHPGFWIVDPDSEGQRWYARSDGSHPYIFGNTHYTFLSGYKENNQPSGNDIAADIRGNAEYFKKLRFGLSGDYYPHPTVKPFFDDEGNPTDWGDYSHRPNPAWFHERVDLAVKTAYETDLIADLILAGPDLEESRSTLRARHNHGDPAPFLKYIAARYGSFPNVWICLCNEYEIRKPTYTEEEIARFGVILKNYLPYKTPLSVHSTPNTLWSAAFSGLPEWHDHQIIQKKIRALAPAADVIQKTWENKNRGNPLHKPTINDELSYQGKGDKHSKHDTIESHLGAFLGGGYASTGEKPGNKLGQYFRGKFDPKEHSAAEHLKWLRECIDQNVTFWNMKPDLEIFSNLDDDFRGMAWPNHEYVLGTNHEKTGLIASLPEGEWIVTQFDVIDKTKSILSTNAGGRFEFNSPDSRAVLFLFKKK